MSTIISFRHVSKHYAVPDGRTRVVLEDVNVDVTTGRTVAIMGRSGSGKSTFLNLIAGIDLPTRGEVTVDGRRLEALSERERTLLRRDLIGLVFQFFHLLPHLSVGENVSLPAMIAGDRPNVYRPRVLALLDRVGLADRAEDLVGKLSGGEMQRVAICRALLRKPRLLLADEPTGNLDDETGRRVMAQLLELVRVEKTTLVYVTHSRELAALADDRWRLHGGSLETS